MHYGSGCRVGVTGERGPPYSPDLNPIEMHFSKLKHLLRQAGERTREALWHRITELLTRFSPKECENYIRHAGYGSSNA